MKTLVLTLMLVFSFFSTVHAEDAVPAQVPPGFDPAAMAEAKIKGAPGEKHKVLESLTGNWNYTMSARMAPDAEPMQSTGSVSNKMILGGRYLQQETKGSWMGEEFLGLGFTGYDNVKQEYNSVWMDNMSTGMMKSTGQYDPATQTIAEEGTFSCPMTGEKDMKVRSELKMVDANSFNYSMFVKDKTTGAEYKSMEIKYQRA